MFAETAGKAELLNEWKYEKYRLVSGRPFVARPGLHTAYSGVCPLQGQCETPVASAGYQEELRKILSSFASIRLGRGAEPTASASEIRNTTGQMSDRFQGQDKLMADYNDTRKVYAALNQADVKTWRRYLRSFVQRCEKKKKMIMGADKTQIAVNELNALSQLGGIKETKAVLPETLPRDFRGACEQYGNALWGKFQPRFGPPPDLEAQRYKMASR
ncbi:hypothetical protein FQN54_009116 [Arachnomyces sp. PD_36]|nr:hypothetical protein FQN54_009116 [Arachnomyces sp. PD_36]